MSFVGKHFNSLIIKEFQASPVQVICIRGTSFCHDLSFVDALFEEARKDFPGLKREDVTVRTYKDPVRHGSIGLHIEPSGKLMEIPETYTRIEAVPDYY